MRIVRWALKGLAIVVVVVLVGVVGLVAASSDKVVPGTHWAAQAGAEWVSDFAVLVP